MIQSWCRVSKKHSPLKFQKVFTYFSAQRGSRYRRHRHFHSSDHSLSYHTAPMRCSLSFSENFSFTHGCLSPPCQASALLAEPNSRRHCSQCIEWTSWHSSPVPLAADVLPLTSVPSGWFFSFLSPRTCWAMAVPSRDGMEGNGVGDARALACRPGTAGHTQFNTCSPVTRGQVHGSLRWHF